ncbi:MAG: hypothetical protein N3A54_05460, partial [Patescibacteria group bacterium]|nr:hypothetical protein [Patescibacteria group bacterium]
PPTPQHDDKIYSRKIAPRSREELKRVSPQHLIATIATNPDNVHSSWWWALQNIADLHHHRAQAIAHIDPDIAEKKIARWCAKVIEHGYQSVLTILHDRRHLLWDFLPSPTNSHIDQETLRTVADSIAFQNIAASFLCLVDHRAYQWLHAALQRNATTPEVEKACQRIFQKLYLKDASIDNPHSWDGYQERDMLCFFFGSTQAAIDFLQRVPLENQTERDARDRICKILAEEHHDQAPYDTPPMPQVPNNKNRQRWQKLWNILHHAHHKQMYWVDRELNKLKNYFTSFTRRDSMPSTIDTLRTFAAHASPHAQRTLAKQILLSLAEENEITPQQRESLHEAVLAPLLDHDLRSVPAVCCAALVGRCLEHGQTPHPMFGKMLPEILAFGRFVPSPSQRALAAAWALAQAQNGTEKERYVIEHEFFHNFDHYYIPAFSQAWKKICPLQEQQQHLLQHPAALLMPTPDKDESGPGYSYGRYMMRRQSENIFGQDYIAAVSVLVALPADALPRDSTPVLELIARNDRARKAFTEHFGHETLCGALTSLLLNAEDERQRQDAAQALAYLSKDDKKNQENEGPQTGSPDKGERHLFLTYCFPEKH